VVCNALKSDEAKAGQFQLASRNDVLPNWQRRGYPEEMESPGNLLLLRTAVIDGMSLDQAEALIRCLPGEDATNGFFVSCFTRGNQTNSTKRKMGSKDTEAPTQKPRKKKRKTIKNKLD